MYGGLQRQFPLFGVFLSCSEFGCTFDKWCIFVPQHMWVLSGSWDRSLSQVGYYSRLACEVLQL
jgi:hypothetical protein